MRLTNLTMGQATKFAWLGDRIRRAAWPTHIPSIAAPGYPRESAMPTRVPIMTVVDITAEDWIAETTPVSV